ncbi:hypothetical protein M405DRAFT_810409 [Rhizopogon salebrosus TDB-379]|nr:hypothetical protein M405DRAFT_810409 [Rhizopogon salebrosus TDB-379]
MSTTSKNAQSATPNSLSPSSRVSGDAGALELGIESAWTRDDFFVAGVELSESQRAEPRLVTCSPPSQRKVHWVLPRILAHRSSALLGMTSK